MNEPPVLEFIITCPRCGHRQKEIMPVDTWFFLRMPELQSAASPEARGLLRILLVRIGALPAHATENMLPMKRWINNTALFLLFTCTFMSGDVHAQMMGAPMSGAGMMAGMMWLMAAFWLLIAVMLILAIAALIKYLFRK